MNHDSLVIRLANMLFKLNQGESINPKTLAQEFNVSVRTIQRDINERFAYLPIQKHDGRYSLSPDYLGRISAHNIRNFAAMSGIQGLFPNLDMAFLRQLYEQETLKTINVQGHAYESFDQEQKQKFDAITQAIALLNVLQFDYTKSNQEKHAYTVEPYRLINNKGIWYLAAKDRDKLKSFAISRIEALQISNQHYKFDPNVGAELDEEDSIWLGQKTTVILKVTGNAKQYFKRRQLVPKQRLLSEAEDHLMVSTQIAHENQLLPIVRYWIPDVEIIEPQEMQDALGLQLNDYLQNFE